jgi:hypothetical protein
MGRCSGPIGSLPNDWLTLGLAPSAFLATHSILSLKENAARETIKALDSIYVDDYLQSLKMDLEASETIIKLIFFWNEIKC